ncbi:MAG: hypothetical protein WCI52_02615 [bacterium]
MKQILSVVFSIVAFAVSMCALLNSISIESKLNEQNNRLIAWNTYQGQYGDYHVLIEERKKGDGKTERHVSLERNSDKNSDPRLPVAVTASNYDDLGQWNHLSIRQNLADGFNTVHFRDDGSRIWDPCTTDKDRVQPFTDEQIKYVKTLIGQAVFFVYNNDHKHDNLKQEEELKNLRYAHE